MSFLSSVQSTVMPFVIRVQDMIGRVIFDYTGVASNEYVNQAVFYVVGSFMLYMVWLLLKPAENIYSYRPQHRH